MKKELISKCKFISLILRHKPLELKPIIPPKFLYHGTKIDNYDSIIDKGILKMNRQ